MSENSANALKQKLLKPARDVRSLLRWGYPKFGTIRFVAEHSGLSAEERQILVRVILAPDRIVSRVNKKLGCDEIRGKDLFLDGYNVLLTADSLLCGEFMWYCDDSFIRDTRFYFGKTRQVRGLEKALAAVLEFLCESDLKSAVFIFDSQISKSGQLAAFVRKNMAEKSLNGDARTSKQVDFDLKSAGQSGDNVVIATSDGIIIDAVPTVLDLPGCLMERRGIKAIRLY